MAAGSRPPAKEYLAPADRPVAWRAVRVQAPRKTLVALDLRVRHVFASAYTGYEALDNAHARSVLLAILGAFIPGKGQVYGHGREEERKSQRAKMVA